MTATATRPRKGRKPVAPKPANPSTVPAGETETLAGMAREINARLDKADQAQGKADDFRLSAAQYLAKAKTACADLGRPFKKWCDEHLKRSYDEARKLAVVGASADPKAALADMRASNAKRNKVSRANKRKAAPASAGRVESAPRARRSDPIQQQVGTLAAMDDDKRRMVVDTVANGMGLAMIPRDQLAKLRSKGDDDDDAGRSLEAIKRDVLALGVHDRTALLSWLVTRVENDRAQGAGGQRTAAALDGLPDQLKVGPSVTPKAPPKAKRTRRKAA